MSEKFFNCFSKKNGDFSGVTKKGKLCHLISIQSTHFVQKLETFRVLINFRFCDTTVLLRWSLLYGCRWLQFSDNGYSMQSYFCKSVAI